MLVNRRGFLRSTGGAATALLASGPLADVFAQGIQDDFAGYGPLVKDPGNLLDLPEGFTYRVISRSGEIMTDGLPRPSLPDGMWAFSGPGGTTVLCCNHEIDAVGSQYPVLKPGDVYNAKKGGGTTTLVVNRDNQVLMQYASNAGTARNCAGGPTPWGTWLTCEETEEANHGYVFEVDPLRASSRRLPALGRFSHEAVAFDPRTGVLYLTEDKDDSLLYRFRPAEGATDRFQQGVLEALTVREAPARYDLRRPYEVAWVPIEIPDPKAGQRTTRAQGRSAGAVRFVRGEGACYGAGSIYFVTTSGGTKRLGQVWRLTPSAEGDRLELWAEPQSSSDLRQPDNILYTATGDIYVCEDGSGADRLIGITPAGKYFELAKGRRSDDETAGATWGPDGRTLFFNLQNSGLTLAITGPLRVAPTGVGPSIARALPPRHLEPVVPSDYLMAALDRGYGKLEAAALHRLGLHLA
jgi:secreted PhoX family phosphatase